MALAVVAVLAATSLQDSEPPYRIIIASRTLGGAFTRIFSASMAASAAGMRSDLQAVQLWIPAVSCAGRWSARDEFRWRLSMLSVLLLGAIEMGGTAFAAIAVQNAANAGSQYGTMSSTAAADTTGIQNAATADAQGVALGPTTSSLSCICSDGSASTCLPTDCSSSNIETILTVNTQATVDMGFRLSFLPNTLTVHGQAIRKVLE